MKNSKELVICLSLQNKGNWNGILDDIKVKKTNITKETKKEYSLLPDKTLTLLDNEYPEYLKQGFKPAFVYYYQGNIELLYTSKKKLGVIGTDYATELLQDQQCVLVVSNRNRELILMTNKPMICVLNCAISMLDKKLTNHILNNGGLILTEYPYTKTETETQFESYRIIGSICDKLLVLNTQKYSKDLIIVCVCLENGKDILVLPRSYTENETYENNYLIREGAIPVCDKETLKREIIGW